ncbi:G protein beta subunit [Culex quinquefasciatus]|uniref:G protein beta subunit n=1 Tax=Culex quinquefasciatus TaxID=7176 RepID=B0WCW4_CULQU|nr:G protein beta subunit [Culex quinquefasciatus]|eukprot:XP_001846548.1 G protein beta subunit [Culex quinquefasciatus]
MPIIENGCSSPEGANAGTWNLCVGLARDVSQHASRNLFWSVPVGDDSQRRLDIAGKSDAKLSRSPANESVQFCAEPVGSDMMATEMMMLMPQNGLVGIQFGQENRHTLTGHSGKVMAAKFLGSAFLVTGSHDRTLKVWDLKNRSCTETKFAGSSCNDLVTTDSSSIISGHFDKKIRFWDTRTADCTGNDIPMQGKITSLDLSKDSKFLLCCVRDDTINLLDLRQNKIVRTFRSDNFKVGCDWSRVAFSPTCQRFAAGSADGSVFVWNINGPLESVLKDTNGNGAAVTAVSWHPFSSVLASVDRAKKCTIWANA